MIPERRVGNAAQRGGILVSHGHVGPYELRTLIGSGGMGEVYEAFDREQNRLVALKLLPRALMSDDQFIERFRRESLAAAQLNDPHVIPIHRYGVIDGRPYIDMRLVPGADLADFLDRNGALNAEQAISYIAQAAEALDAAHAANLIHRDVKPSNLLVTPQGFVYLVDFGIARAFGVGAAGRALTATGATIGTLDYMAPERFAGGTAVDARIDVYSLACVLYECLADQRPFPVEGLPALMHAHLTTPPPRITARRNDLPTGMDDVIAKGMAKDPGDRYTSAGELARAAAAVVRTSAPMVAPATEVRSSFSSAAPPTVVPGGLLRPEPSSAPTSIGPSSNASTAALASNRIVQGGATDRSRRRVGWVVGTIVAVALVAILAILPSFQGGSGSGSVTTNASEAGSSSVTGSSADSSASGGAPATTSGGSSVPPATAVAAPVPADQLPSASGAFGEKPTLTFPANDPVPSLQRVILSEGTGPVTASNDWLITNYLGQIWGGAVFDNSYDRGATSAFQIGVGKVVPGWDTALVGVPVGSRVMLSLPPADGYGSAGNSGAGITGTDTLVFIVDIVQAITPTTGGQTDAIPQTPPANSPEVAGALGAAATVTIPSGLAEPTAPSVAVLATGTGAPVQLGQVLVQYTAVTWTGESAGTTWPGGDASTGGTGPQELPVATGGPFAGLVGVPLGSRVLVQIPGQTDQQSGQTQPAIAAVVDLLIQTNVTPATTSGSDSAAPTASDGSAPTASDTVAPTGESAAPTS